MQNWSRDVNRVIDVDISHNWDAVKSRAEQAHEAESH
jgi:hypothetical protein